MRKKRLITIILIIVTILNVYVYGYAEDEVSREINNRILTLVRSIQDNMPIELKSDGISVGDKVNIAYYARYARAIHYTDTLNDLIVNTPAKVSESDKELAGVFMGQIADLSPYFEGASTITDVTDLAGNKAKLALSELLLKVYNNTDASQEQFRTEFNQLKDIMVVWAEMIKFLSDESIYTQAIIEEKQNDYNELFLELASVARQLNLNLNIGYLNSLDVHFEGSGIIEEFFNPSNKDISPWYMEILTLSSKVNGDYLEDYVHFLTPESKVKYEMYKNHRMVLMVGDDVDPIKTLSKKNASPTLRVSSYKRFKEDPDESMVLYLQKGSATDYTTNDLTTEETQTDVDKDIKNENAGYIPVYLKSKPSKGMSLKNSKSDALSVEKSLGTNTYSDAFMNHIQFVNSYESGKMNDMSSDDNYPLYISIFGNIETHSGKILVPAVANQTLLADDMYFPLNAYFINNYPIESKRDFSEGTLYSNPSKYAIYMKSLNENDGVADNPLEMLKESTTFQPFKFKKSNNIARTLFGGYNKSGNEFPKIIPFVTNADGTQSMFMDIIEVEQPKWGFIGASNFYYLGLQETTTLNLDGTKESFVKVFDTVPVEKINFNFFYGPDGDKRLWKNDILAELTISTQNHELKYDLEREGLKSKDVKSSGYKLGSLLEPVFETLAKSEKNYILYTPSVSEFPGVNRYISVYLMPIVNIITMVALFLVIIETARKRNVEITKLAISLAVVFMTNWLVSNFYPAVLGIGFNGSTSSILGDKAHYLALYNYEKDLNNRAEFQYKRNPSKISTRGPHIKLAELNKDDIRVIRSSEENAPWKDSRFYIPSWDSNEIYVSSNMYLKNNDLNIHVKDLFDSANVNFTSTGYQTVWHDYIDYAYYIPYLHILEGITQTINNYVGPEFTPQRIRYSDGELRLPSGGAMTYFTSKYFLTDENMAYSMGEEDPQFLSYWKSFNNSDFLNLQSVLLMEENAELSISPKIEFSEEAKEYIMVSRWYKTATNGRTDKDLSRRIKDVNINVRKYVMDLIPYMDTVADEIIIKSVALFATQEFSKEFSHNPIEKMGNVKDGIVGLINGRGQQDYFRNLYPKKINITNLSLDEHLKLSIINLDDLLQFNITSIFHYLELKSHWFGMIIFFLLTLLMYVRSLMRITFISIILMVILIYMLIVYAVQRDYSNKTIFGMVQTILISLGVYFIDNLMLVGFMNFDKSSSGVLMLLLTVWLIWNVVATSIYIQLFMYIFRDLKAFGGNIFLENANTILAGATKVGKAILRPISQDRAENFDLTNANWEVSEENFREYMERTPEEKRADIIDDLYVTGKKAEEKFGEAYGSVVKGIPKKQTLREYYVNNKDKDNLNVIVTRLDDETEDYLKRNNIIVTKSGQYARTLDAPISTWNKIMEENKIVTDNFGLFKDNLGVQYIPRTDFNKDMLIRSGLNFEETKDALILRNVGRNQLDTLTNLSKSELYQINGERGMIYDKIRSSGLKENEYSLGKNGIYLKSEEIARSLFGGNYTRMYQTSSDVKDYTERLSDGTKVLRNMDILNGMTVTSEHIYGNVPKAVVSTLLNQGIKLTRMGNETYKFSNSDRGTVLQHLDNSTRYIQREDGLQFLGNKKVSSVWGLKIKGEDDLDEFAHEDYDDTDNYLPLPNLEKERVHNMNYEIENSRQTIALPEGVHSRYQEVIEDYMDEVFDQVINSKIDIENIGINDMGLDLSESSIKKINQTLRKELMELSEKEQFTGKDLEIIKNKIESEILNNVNLSEDIPTITL